MSADIFLLAWVMFWIGVAAGRAFL